MPDIISIIVPVYNVEKYLPGCIDSVLGQSFINWELLLVDDGSTDSSGAICDAYVKKDARIRVLHGKNGGVSHARNRGMDAAIGAWLTFIDGDDWIAPDFLASMYAPVQADLSLDFVHAGCRNYVEGVGYSINQQYAFEQSSDPVVLMNRFRGLIVSKLFKNSIIRERQLRFDEQMKIAEDYAFTLDYLAFVHRYCFVEATGYFYRLRSGSATQSAKRRDVQEQLAGLAHHIASLTAYVSEKGVTRQQASKRWGAIAGMIYETIREQGFFRMGREVNRQLVDYLQRYALIQDLSHPIKRIYLQLFLFYATRIHL